MSNQLPCPHCKKTVKHKNQCKKFTQEVQDAHNKYLDELQKIKAEKEKKDAEEKAKLNNDINKFKEEYPSLWNYFENKFKDYEYRISEAEYSCNCNCKYNDDSYSSLNNY